MYIIRLDDASTNMDINRWEKIENLLDKYDIKPIVGIIPENKDETLLKYEYKNDFWDKAKKWESKGWTIAMHGFEHVYNTEEGGINPIQKRSEFAGLSLNEQKNKIRNGYNLLIKHNLKTKIFFAPSHTFDKLTMTALKEETPIRIISDTIANDIYYKDDFYFIPQQSGKVRNLKFKIVTFCYHPNTMKEEDYIELEEFIRNNRQKFVDFNILKMKKRKLNLYDKLIRKIYFMRR